MQISYEEYAKLEDKLNSTIDLRLCRGNNYICAICHKKVSAKTRIGGIMRINEQIIGKMLFHKKCIDWLIEDSKVTFNNC